MSSINTVAVSMTLFQAGVGSVGTTPEQLNNVTNRLVTKKVVVKNTHASEFLYVGLNNLATPETETQSITNGDRTGGTMDLVFNLADSQTFSVLSLAWNANAATTQTAVDNAAATSINQYSPGDIGVTGGPFGAGGSATIITFSGSSVNGDHPLITINGTSLTGGTTDPISSETTAGVVSTGHRLSQNETVELNVKNASQIYIVGSNPGTTYTWYSL